jgi:U3 small nucleolar ribonucleoprotein protein IMP4
MGMREVIDLSQEPILIVGEFHGNPGSLAFYDQEGTCLLSIYISMSGFESTNYSKLKVIEPVIIGETELVNNISNILSIERAKDTNHIRYILMDDEKMEFFNSNELLLKILIKSFKEFP